MGFCCSAIAKRPLRGARNRKASGSAGGYLLEKEVRSRLPLHTLQGVVCFGNVASSPFLLGACAEHGITLSFLTEHGRFLARVEGPVTGNILLRWATRSLSGI